VALLVGFDGARYFGSQLNFSDEECPAVENVVWRAMVAAGCVLPSNADDPAKVSFGSASRTDRGVSAARFLVSAKLEVPKGGAADGGFDEEGRADGVADRLNALLPNDVRVFSVCMVTQKFRPRPCCNWREYEYLLPRKLFQGMGAEAGTEAGAEAAIDAFDRALRTFEGTHSFANFCKAKKVAKRFEENTQAHSSEGAADGGDGENTDGDADEEGRGSAIPKRSSSKDASAPKPIRGIVYACEVVDRNWSNGRGSGFVRVRVNGQAFFYNQIRMMVGAACAVAGGGLAPRTLARLLAMPGKLELPAEAGEAGPLSFFATAPGAGLLLLDAGFDRHPKQSVATDARRAAALAERPQFVLLSAAQARRNEAWAEDLRARIASAWGEVPAPRRAVAAAEQAAPSAEADEDDDASGEKRQSLPLVDSYLARLRAAAAAAGPSVAAVNAAFEAGAALAGEAAAAKQEKEAKRRAFALLGVAGRVEQQPQQGALRAAEGQLLPPPPQRQGGGLSHRALLPDGFSTAVATHCRLPPGRVVADLQRGLCAAVRRGDLPNDATTADLLAYVDQMSAEALVAEGASERAAKEPKPPWRGRKGDQRS
jgi:tRNA pseudouridine(38-40) synthase